MRVESSWVGFSSVQFSHSVVSDSFWPHGLQHTRLPCPSLSEKVKSEVAQLCLTLCNSMDCSTPGFPVLHYLLEFAQTHVHWVGDNTQSLSSLTPFSSCPQIFPTSESFPVSWLFISGGQSIRASVSTSVLPMNIQDWFPLGLTGLISLLSKELSRVFFSTTVQKHQFFGAQPSLWFNSHICTWLLEKP